MAYIGIDPNVGDISFQTVYWQLEAHTAFTLAQSSLLLAAEATMVVTIGNVSPRARE